MLKLKYSYLQILNYIHFFEEYFCNHLIYRYMYSIIRAIWWKRKGLKCTLVFLFLFPAAPFAQQSNHDFACMKGKLISHAFADPEDSLSAREIVELRNDSGLPEWFSRDFQKVVCLTGECRMIHLQLFWDGAGNYLGLQVHEKEPLTKTDHNEFIAADYEKLDRILSDSTSVLKKLKQDELVILPEKTNLSVDARSGATLPSLQEYLVKNAAYTCYTLWHTVYGNTREEIEKLLEKRVDKGYLKTVFDQDDPKLLIWAIKYIGNHPGYNSKYYRQIINQMLSKNENLAQTAMDYFEKERLAQPEIQRDIIQVFNGMTYQRKMLFLMKLSSVQPVNDEVVLDLLKLFEAQQLESSLLGYVYKFIHADNLKNPDILAKLKAISNDESLYVRNITQRVLLDTGY